MNIKKIDTDYESPSVFYSRFYNSVIFGKGFGPRSIRKTHQQIEGNYAKNFSEKVLEIGGGGGEHLDFIQHGFNEYFLTDIKMPVINGTWKDDVRINCRVENAERLTFKDESFDRVISTCLLHHVEQPKKVFEEILRVLKPKGVATIFMPCDPGLAVRILRALTTARSAKKNGFKGYNLMISREHRNHVGSLRQRARFVFRNRKLNVGYFPLYTPSWNLNGYLIIHIS
jgi:ubiquinone/menaquinone biosynthesis C-methylase UbiE